VALDRSIFVHIPAAGRIAAQLAWTVHGIVEAGLGTKREKPVKLNKYDGSAVDSRDDENDRF
jgi:hypothetical protein